MEQINSFRQTTINVVSVGRVLPAKPDHIRELCERAVTAQSEDELQKIISELRSALRDQMDNVRSRAVEVREKIFRAA